MVDDSPQNALISEPPTKNAAQPGRPAAKKATSTRKKAPRPVEPEPVVSGRMVLALTFAVAMSIIPISPLGRMITKTSPKTTERANWVVGQTANVHITTVTADYLQLACADKRSSGKAHCEWENDRERWPQDEQAPVDNNKADVLQPYRTTDKQLLLLPGLWRQPEIAMRLHSEPSRGVGSAKLARFVVDCEVKFLEEWEKPLIRWTPSDKWSDQGKAMIGEIVKCHLLEEEKS